MSTFLANPETQQDRILLAACYFINKNQQDHKGLTPLKLQKLLYYTKAWSLVFNNGKNIFPDQFEAWVHGPANAKVYHAFKGLDFESTHTECDSMKFEAFSVEEKEILDMVWNSYGKYDGKFLEQLTHEEEPWLKARQGLNPETASQSIITEDSMKTFYERRLQETSGGV